MARPSTLDIYETQTERIKYAEGKAADAEAAQQLGWSIYWRTIALDASTLLAFLKGDTASAAVAEIDKRKLEASIKQMDQELLDARVAVSLAELRRAA